MIQDLADRIWETAEFHSVAERIEHAWLKREIRAEVLALPAGDVAKLIQASAILACSDNQEHRKAAYRAATCCYELSDPTKLPFDQALRVILTRLGNFPSLGTRKAIEDAIVDLPVNLAAEEASATDARRIRANHETLYLTDFQHALWGGLIEGQRIAISAPTSAGKSFVLEHFLSVLFAKPTDACVVYLVPTRALIAQVSADLAEQFRGFDGLRPAIVPVPLDSETKLPSRAIYVMTQERVQLMLMSHPTFKADVVIVDEAHSIGEGSRGVLLQWVVDDLLARKRDAQMLFASPTIRNLDVFGRLFGLKDVKTVFSGEPTVSQNFLVVKIDGVSRGKVSVLTARDGTQKPVEVAKFELKHALASRIEKLVHISAVLGRGQSNIIYANGQDEAEKIAIQLADLFSDRETTPAQKALAELSKEAVHEEYVLADCVQKGVAYHYSNMPTQLRRAIEQAAANGDVDYLVCTSTLLQGVNLPAKNIFMVAPTKGIGKPLESTDFWNLSGRAGRLRREFQGNIFLIDYENWEKKPLDGPKDAVVTPAIETSAIGDHENLVSVITNGTAHKGADKAALETSSVRLYFDMVGGELTSTFERIGVTDTDGSLIAALRQAEREVTLPAAIIRQSPNISARKQQQLYDEIDVRVANGSDEAKVLIPAHPRDNPYMSYQKILELCHRIVLEIDTSKNLHKFHAVMCQKWMTGMPLPRIVDEQIKRSDKKTRPAIRDALDVIETDIRFQAVRLFGCYSTLLAHSFTMNGYSDLLSSIPTLSLYLEVGASDRSMVSFISLGLSRIVSSKLNEYAGNKNMDVPEALAWLGAGKHQGLQLSPLLAGEIERILSEQG